MSEKYQANPEQEFPPHYVNLLRRYKAGELSFDDVIHRLDHSDGFCGLVPRMKAVMLNITVEDRSNIVNPHFKSISLDQNDLHKFYLYERMKIRAQGMKRILEQENSADSDYQRMQDMQFLTSHGLYQQFDDSLSTTPIHDINTTSVGSKRHSQRTDHPPKPTIGLTSSTNTHSTSIPPNNGRANSLLDDDLTLHSPYDDKSEDESDEFVVNPAEFRANARVNSAVLDDEDSHSFSRSMAAITSRLEVEDDDISTRAFLDNDNDSTDQNAHSKDSLFAARWAASGSQFDKEILNHPGFYPEGNVCLRVEKIEGISKRHPRLGWAHESKRGRSKCMGVYICPSFGNGCYYRERPRVPRSSQ